VLSWKHTRKLSGKVKAVTGKGRLRQVLEQFWVALCFSISPKKYYVFELFRPERFRNARHYIARYEFKGGLHNLLESRIENPSRRILNDKAKFFRHCEERGVATPPSFLLMYEDGSHEALAQIDAPAEVRARITHRYYDAGHMMYTRQADLVQMKSDLAAWLDSGAPSAGEA
jgi:hypothetical protein